MPFLGAARCEISEIAAGDRLELVLDYEVGASGLADGAWIKAAFKFYSDWALFQTTNPGGENYVSAEYQARPRCCPGRSPRRSRACSAASIRRGTNGPSRRRSSSTSSTAISIPAIIS